MILIGKFQFTELTAQQKLNNPPLPAAHFPFSWHNTDNFSKRQMKQKLFSKRGLRGGSPAKNGRKKAGNLVPDFLLGMPLRAAVIQSYMAAALYPCGT